MSTATIAPKDGHTVGIDARTTIKWDNVKPVDPATAQRVKEAFVAQQRVRPATITRADVEALTRQVLAILTKLATVFRNSFSGFWSALGIFSFCTTLA